MWRGSPHELASPASHYSHIHQESPVVVLTITANQLIVHALGDYFLQSDWMASDKTSNKIAALAHALTYTLPFLFLTGSPLALLVIAGTHFVIDHGRLARYVCWAKNLRAPRRMLDGKVRRCYDWSECQITGYGPDKPGWLAVWLLIITDNVMHVICNAVALEYL